MTTLFPIQSTEQQAASESRQTEQPAAAVPGPSTEQQAVAIALNGSRRARRRLARRALLRLAKDPADTQQAFLLGVSVNAGRLPSLVHEFVSDPAGAALIEQRPSIDGTTAKQLADHPADTLGGAYVRFLEQNQLDADLFQEPPGMPPVPAYVAKRLRQSHDVWHVATGYGPDLRGELALQAFTYAQTKAPSARLIALLGLVRYGLRQPSLAVDLVKAYRRGRKARSLLTVPWESMWQRPLSEVQNELGLSQAA